MKAIKRLTALLLVMVIAFSATTTTQAACTTPSKVKTAAKNCISETGWCIVIDQGANKMYVLKQTKTGKWKTEKSFRCVCSDYLNPKYHYFLLRNRSTDQRAWGDSKTRWSYGMLVDCHEDLMKRELRIQSYVQKYNKKTKKWVTKKDGVNNNFGWSVCEANAKWLYVNCKDGTAVMSVD